MNYQLDKDLVYAIEGEFSFSEFELGYLVDNFDENDSRKDFCSLTDDDGWLRLEVIDIDIIGDNEIICFFSDFASCKVRAEKFDVRIANEDEAAEKFVF